MSRISRKHMTHSFNHVMVRGNNKQTIFCCDDDFRKFSELLGTVSEKYHCEVHLFCFMSNHVHLLIKTFIVPLSRIMAVLLANYSKYFSKRYKFIGHLFQRRFLAKHVNHNDYFLELIYYIHTNPLKAKMVNNLECYSWSSHNSYFKQTCFSWLHTEYLKSLISHHKGINYGTYIKAKLLDEEIATVFCQFDENNLLTLTDADKKEEEKAELLNLTYFDFASIANVVCKVTQISFEQLCSISQNRQVSLTRSLVAYFAHFMGKISLKYIAIQFERHVTSVSDRMYHNMKHKNFHALQKKCQAEFQKLIADKMLVI